MTKLTPIYLDVEKTMKPSSDLFGKTNGSAYRC